MVAVHFYFFFLNLIYFLYKCFVYTLLFSCLCILLLFHRYCSDGKVPSGLTKYTLTHVKVVLLSEYKYDWMANPLTRSKPFLSLLWRSDILVKSKKPILPLLFQILFWPVIGANSSASQHLQSGNPLSPIFRLLWGVTWHWTPAVRGTLTAQQ